MFSEIHLFLLASIIVIITPGQDLLLVFSRSISQGAKAGVLTALGVSCGLIGHSMLTAFGVGAILLHSATLFTVVKAIGAMYLFYLGIILLLSKPTEFNVSQKRYDSSRRLFITGALSNISNPKVTIFYFAFLPQFISSNQTAEMGQLLCLGSLFALLTFIVKAGLGLCCGKCSQYLLHRKALIARINTFSGMILLGLGVRLLFEKNA